MTKIANIPRVTLFCLIIPLVLLLASCDGAYYEVMEKFGHHKRDILVDRVKETQKAQDKAEEEFISALDQFKSVVTIQNTNLEMVYEELNGDYEDCQASAQEVYDRIKEIESVSSALFDEWKEEITLYTNDALLNQSNWKLKETYRQYEKMILLMKQSVDSMAVVLYILRDNVLFLKHNLNAQAIGALQTEFSTLQLHIDELIQRVQVSINTSNSFIKEMRNQNSSPPDKVQ